MYKTDDRNAAIKEIKKYLYTLSQSIYPSIKRTTIDGIYDDETRDAVKDFQAIKGYPRTGVVDFKTFTALYNEYVLALDHNQQSLLTDGNFPMSIGDMNEDVRLLHIYVNELAKIYTTIDNIGTSNYYSNETADAIEALSALFMLKSSKSTDKTIFDRILYDVKNRPYMF